MLAEGREVPAATVWSAPGERRSIDELLDGGRALFLFYLFDWSAT